MFLIQQEVVGLFFNIIERISSINLQIQSLIDIFLESKQYCHTVFSFANVVDLGWTTDVHQKCFITLLVS